MKIKQLLLTSTICVASAAILASCQSTKNTDNNVAEDCSGIFETRHVNKNQSKNKNQSNKNENKGNENNQEEARTECKVLEIKLDNDSKCEIVGSNKIDDLKEALEKGRDDRLVVIAPQKQFKEMAKTSYKFLMANGIDLRKHMNSDVFENLKFPYKGMKCDISDKKFVIWTGDKKVIFTMQNL